MSFFKKLFGSNKKKTEPTQPPQPAVTPNTPPQPPSVFTNLKEHGLPDFSYGLSGNPGIDVISVIGGLTREMKERNLPLEIKGFYYTQLFEGGALKIPVIFASGAQKYALFFVYDEAGARAFQSAKELVKETDYPIALYVSQVDCSRVTDKASALTTLNLADLSYQADVTLTGEYAMWWSVPGDMVFHESKSKAALDGIYDCVQGYESYALGFLLSELKVKGFEEFQRVAMPQEYRNFAVKGPEYLDIVISVSEEKGMQFQFPKEKASPEYRARFLEQVRAAFQAFQLMLVANNAPKDEPTDTNGSDWFSFMSRVVEKREKSGEIKGDFVIGTISFE